MVPCNRTSNSLQNKVAEGGVIDTPTQEHKFSPAVGMPNTPLQELDVVLDPAGVRNRLISNWVGHMPSQLPILPQQDMIDGEPKYKEPTLEAIKSGSQSPDFKYDEVHLYTDGSGPHTNKNIGFVLGAWAIAIILVNTHTPNKQNL